MSSPKSILTSLNLRPRKRFSQNFLTSDSWAEKLAGALLPPGHHSEVWEIGPGLGAVTKPLIDRVGSKLTVFEIDRDLVAYLRENFQNLKIVEGDFLKLDLSKYLPASGTIALISNLPYQSSSPIFFKLLELRRHWNRMVLTFQREVADRLVATPGNKSYGTLSILAQTYYKMNSLGVLKGGAFYPAPEVQSKALLFEPLRFLKIDFESLRLVVKAAFKHRRKKMLNNLKLEFEERVVLEAFKGLGLSTNVRAEAVSVQNFHELSRRL